MPVLKNARHERFAQELAKGKPASTAYAVAGYKPDRSAAARLSAKIHISSRVAELQERFARKAEVTTESLTRELEEARALALAESQASAAVAATMGKAKLHGKIVDRKHVTGTIGTYDLTQATDEQLDQLEAILGPLAEPSGNPGGEDEADA